MLLTKKENIMEETLTDKEIEIIDYVNDQLFQYETKAKKEIAVLVKEKFGSDGEEVWSMLEGDDSSIDLDAEIEGCPECGKISEEWMEKTRKQMEQMEDLFDDTYDETVNFILEKHPDASISSD